MLGMKNFRHGKMIMDRTKKRLDVNSSHVILILFICAYCVINQPFMSVLFVSQYIRNFVEITTIFLLIILQKKRNIKNKRILLLVALIMTTIAFNSYVNINTVASLASRVLFFFLFLSILARYYSTRLILKKTWIIFWGINSILVILSFVLFETSLIKFDALYLGNVSDWAGQNAQYQYYFNPLFGTISMTRIIFNYEIGRISGYFFEPGLLAFFFGFNIIASKYIFQNKIKKRIFIIINSIAGCLTLSLTFYIAISISIFNLFIEKYLRSKLLILVLALITIGFISYLTLFKFSLFEDNSLMVRTNTADLALESIKDHSMVSFFFGEGVGSFSDNYSSGLNSGLMQVLVEWGFLAFIYILYVLYFGMKNKFSLLIYIMVSSLAFNFFWYPIFWAGVALISCIDEKNNRSISVKHTNVALAQNRIA